LGKFKSKSYSPFENIYTSTANISPGLKKEDVFSLNNIQKGAAGMPH
jgi:hypothetical protein